MKLATYNDGSRDGQLVVVSRDLGLAHYAAGVATRLQQALDDWNFIAPQLQDLYETLNQGKARHAFAFEPRQCMAPLPRAYQWASAPAYGHHLELLGGAPPGEPRLVFLPGDALLGPCDVPRFANEGSGIDIEPGLVVVTGDVAFGASPETALEGVRLLALAGRWVLREAPSEQPAAAFAPVMVTPDELGEAWSGGRASLTLTLRCRGRILGRCDTGVDMDRHFGELIAAAARVRPVRAGSLIGAGPVSNRNGGKGHACIAEQRAAELAADGAASTGYLRFGEVVQLEASGRDGASLFGAIEQKVAGLVDAPSGIEENDAPPQD
jgi:fumarylacetoacetate (FAA) hydrolase